MQPSKPLRVAMWLAFAWAVVFCVFCFAVWIFTEMREGALIFGTAVAVGGFPMGAVWMANRISQWGKG